MSQSEPTLPEIDPVDIELVAYLDEELTPEERARIEQRLADDAHYRTKLRHMQQSWDMLDVLGRVDPDEGFTRTTVEMVALKAKEDVQEETKSAGRLRLLFRLAVAAGTLACAALSYSLVNWYLTAPDRQLVQDLPVIEHLDEYSHAESVEFLKSLDQHGLFAPEADDAPSLAAADRESVEQRRARLEIMTAEQKESILDKKKRFEVLRKEEQDRLRKLYSEIEADPQGERLKKVMAGYHEWLKSIPSKDQLEVLSAPLERRIAKIKEIQTRLASERLKVIASELSSEDVNAISAWLWMYVDNHEKEFARRIPPQFKAGIDKMPPHERVAWYVRGIRWRIESQEFLPEPTDDELATFISVLSPEARQVLEAADSPEQKWQDAKEFIRQVQISKRLARVSEEELKKFAASLTVEQREELQKNRSAEEVKRELRRWYTWQKSGYDPVGGGSLPWMGGFGRGFKAGPPREGPPGDGKFGPPPQRRPGEGKPDFRGPGRTDRPPPGPKQDNLQGRDERKEDSPPK